MPDPVPQNAREPLAIVGMGCRFPGGVRDPEAFWRFLLDRGNGVSVVPADRWDADSHHHPDNAAAGKLVSRWGGFTDGIEEFDAAFFGVSPREAQRMDPQQRRLLEVAWETMEDARVPPSALRGSDTAVLIGLSNSDYSRIQTGAPERIDGYTNVGNTFSIAANRISYFFDWKGPSLALDTACSSGLVAVALACESIWSGQSGTALAGASNLLLLVDDSIGFSKAGMLSPTGICHAFDAAADGYVRAEGIGMVLLKPLRRALAEGDRIHATILAAAVNQDGKTSSLSVPGVPSQRAMLESNLARAGRAPEAVVYVEAHGTGTPVGDPVETRALGEALSPGRDAAAPCLIGSVKTNLGHLEPASGLAGLIKAALVAREGRIPPNLHFSSPNPSLRLDDWKLRVVAETTTLPRPACGEPVVAVNSFGFGGTNAQVLLAPPPARAAAATIAERPAGRRLALPLSARSRESLEELAARHAEKLGAPGTDAAVWSATTAKVRERLEHRLVAIGRDGADLAGQLRGWIDRAPAPGDRVEGPGESVGGKGVVFVFTGQGAHWSGMGRGLLETEPVFRETIAAIDAWHAPLAGWSLLQEWTRPGSGSRLDETEIAQPSLFAMQTGLVALWRSWGVHPAAVTGHSVGEVAAAHAAGILTLGDAVALVFHRSRLQGGTRGGGRMAAAALSADEARERLGSGPGGIEIAAINSPRLVTLAGDEDALSLFLAALEAEGRFARMLPIAHAFHTRRMDPIRGELLAALAGLRAAAGTVPFFSTVTGGPVAGESLDAAYWWRNAREPVRFAPAVERLVDAGHDVFLEIGPHPALGASLREGLAARQAKGAVLHSLKRGEDESAEIARQFAGLFLTEAKPDWEAWHGCRADPSLPLPLYPWRKTPFWLESPGARKRRTGRPDHPLLGMPVESPGRAWETVLDPKGFAWLEDHRIWKQIVFPAAGFLEIALAAGRTAHPGVPVSVEDFTLERMLFLSHEAPPRLRTEIDEGSRRVRIFTRAPEADQWTRHASARIVAGPLRTPPPIDLRELRASLRGPVAHWDFYEGLLAAGYGFGPCFRQIERIWHGDGLGLAEVIVPAAMAPHLAGEGCHAAVLDACFQAAPSAFGGAGAGTPGTPSGGEFLPAALGSLHLLEKAPPPRFWVRAEIVERRAETFLADLTLIHPGGEVFGWMHGFRADRAPDESSAQEREGGFYQFAWERETEEGQSTDATLSKSRDRRQFFLVSDLPGIGASIAGLLRDAGREATLLDTAEALEATLSVPGERERVVVHLGHLGSPEDAALDADRLKGAFEGGVFSLLELAQTLHRLRAGVRVAVVLPASGPEEAATAHLAAAPSLGFLRVAAGELPETSWRAILWTPGPVEDLVAELLRDDPEPEVSLSGPIRRVRRLRRVRNEDLPRLERPTRRADRPPPPYRIECERRGRLDRVVLNETRRLEPGPGEVEVRVRAAGINFRDLMKVLGMYPGTPEELGLLGDDFAGTVLRVGEGVASVKPGDEVVGICPGAFRSHLIADPRMLFAKPGAITSSEGATLPTAFLTAHFALKSVGRLRPGESVLIHAAAGGVGLAAIQVAQAAGLTIYATAGSEEKRELLRSLGVAHVMDSRSLSFAREVMERTGGRGVDAVLNSLAGEFLRKSLGTLAPFGRFLEIGKVDLFADRSLGMRALRNSLSFHVIDLGQFVAERHEDAALLLAEVADAFREGRYRPLPHRAFPAGDATEALQLMARGGHTGKLVLDFDADEVEAGRASEPGHWFSPEVTYLVAGGMSGYGFEVAKWLAGNGARHLALVSRSGPADEAVREGIATLEASGVRARDIRADLADAAAVRRAVAEIEAELPPVGGVFHTAMVLEDRFLHELDRPSFAAALDPKALGAWNLHEATRHRALDCFVLFSSFAAVVGSIRQANYNAGNAFLDALAAHRRSLGLPALSISWGSLAGTGYVERNQRTLAYLETTGVEAYGIGEVLALLGQLIRSDATAIAAAKIDWGALSRLAPAVADSPVFRELVGAGGKGGGISRALLLAAPPERRLRLVEDFLTAQIAAVFGTEENALDRDRSVTQLGLDSLMAIELLNRIEGELDIHFPVGSLLSGPSIRDLAAPVLEKLAESRPGTAGAGGIPADSFLAEGSVQ